jgi:pyruvate/2-oxoglutarate dehydrogenase complex dihydrolipoamide acyltransferase (E2) component
MMVGKVEERALVEDGEVKVVKVIPMRWSFDERIDDGLSASFGMNMVREVLENPREHLGAPS